MKDVQILEAPIKEDETVFYFGFDGDSTRDYLDMAFEQSSEDEVRQRSQIVHEAIEALKKLICKQTRVVLVIDETPLPPDINTAKPQLKLNVGEWKNWSYDCTFRIFSAENNYWLLTAPTSYAYLYRPT